MCIVQSLISSFFIPKAGFFFQELFVYFIAIVKNTVCTFMHHQIHYERRILITLYIEHRK